MPKRRAPKAMNQEIINAIQILTNQNRKVIVRLADIVQVVQTQLKQKSIDLKSYPDQMIKEAIYNIRDLGLIDHIGFNQYCCADCIANVKYEPPEPEPNQKNVDPKYFRPTKTMTEFSTRLDPGKPKPATSSVSLSGNSIEKVRKRFNAKKVLKKAPSNPPLPGARQVPPKRHLTADKCDEVAAKRRRLERYLEGESTSEDDGIDNNLEVITEETRAEIWKGYEGSSEKSITELKDSDDHDAINDNNKRLDKVEKTKKVESTVDHDANRVKAEYGVKVKVKRMKNEP